MPARQIRPTRAQDPEYLAELGGVLLAMTDTQRREFLAGLDRDNLEVAERALAARIAVSWRATPVTMGVHFGALKPWRYSLLLGEKFADAVEGRSIRQIWNISPQTGKSVIASQWGPAWALDRYPDRKLILTSYGDDLANRNSYAVRQILREHRSELRVRLQADQQRQDRFTTPQGGGILAAGIGSALTGFGAAGAIVDDPYKNWVEAHSPARRELVFQQYRSVIRTRLTTEQAFIIVVHCLAAGSRIPVAGAGWVPVEDVRAGEEVFAFDGRRIVRRRVLAQRRSAVGADTVTVRTDRMTLTCTAEHPVLVVPDDGHAYPALRYEWRHAGRLAVGDRLVAAAELPTDGKAPVDGWCEPGRAWLLGFLVGDGWVTTWARHNYDHVRAKTYESRSWAVMAALKVDEALNLRVADALEEAFGRRPKRMKKARYWRLDCNDAGRELTELGLLPGVRAPHKRLPQWLLDAPTATQRSFLRGYLDADGHHPSVGYGDVLGSTSKALLEDVRRLAVACGARTGTVRTHKPQLLQPPNSPEPVWCQGYSIYVTLEGDLRGASLVTGDLPDDLRIDRVRSVTPGPNLDVYDLTVDGEANFVAEGLVAHNTRWHEDDLTARLVKAWQDGTGEEFEVIRIPEVAEAPDLTASDPILRLPDPLGRAPGELLEPERFSAGATAARKLAAGTYLWQSMHLQRPSPEEGTEIQRAWFRLDEAMPERFDDALVSWDPKLKDKEEGDYVVGQCWLRTGSDFWLVDQLRGQWNQATTINAIALMAVKHPDVRRHVIENTGNGPEVMTALRQAMPDYVLDPEMAGQLGMTAEEAAAVQALRRRGLPGLIANTPKGSKSVRMRAHAPLLEAGNVHVNARASWLGAFLDEMAAFPNGSFDDAVDCASQALSRLSHGTASVASPASAPLPTGGPSVRTGARFGVIPGARVR